MAGKLLLRAEITEDDPVPDTETDSSEDVVDTF